MSAKNAAPIAPSEQQKNNISGRLVKSEPEMIGHVYRTFNYDMFKIMHGNRIVRSNHLNKLIKSFEEEQLIVPIIVNEKMEIIDGQHSFNAAKSIGGPIYFIINEGYGLAQVHRLNNNNANWKVDEYMQSYCKTDISDYIEYREFKIKYGFGHQETLALLTGSTNNFSKIFNDGNLKIKDLKAASEMAEKLMDFQPYYKGFRRKSFVYAYIELVKNVAGFDHKEMLQKVKLQSTKLVDCTNKDGYLRLLEELYNYRRSEKTKLRFR